MKILLKKLHMENFKKTKDQTIDFGHITKISGQNAVGKSTVADAFMWCLFNKNSLGEAKFQVRPLDAFGNPIDHVDIKVVVTLDVDGREFELSKTQKQNWVKKRGTLEATLQGNDNLYEIDGVPKKEKDFKTFVSDIINEDLFQLLTNPQAFVSKKWKEQREELMKMIPGVDNDTVIASNPDVLSELNLALSLHTPEDLQAKAKKALSEYKKKQTEIPARVDEVRKSMTDIDVAELELQSAETERDRVIKLLKSLPDKVDCSANAEYQKLQEQITLKEEYLSKMNSGAEIRQQLKIKKNGLMDELTIVEKQIASADNSAKEERIEELEAEMREIAQSVADEEKMLYLLEKFMKAKMMILSKMVNEKFGIVNWKLFDKQVNGAVVECCECMVNGVPYSALNTGHRIVAGLDIIHALSVMHDVTAPIFVDNAEAVNDYNIPEMEGQLVLLQVTDDKELKVEREDMRND